MTDREKAIVMAYTGYVMLAGDKLGIYYHYVQEKLGRCVMTHELANEDVKDAIQEAAKEDFIALAKSDNGWISVKDRLPEATKPDVHGNITFSDYVLTYQTYEDGHNWIAEDTCRVDHGCWMHEVPGMGCKVTHWMPMPEPPKEALSEDAK